MKTSLALRLLFGAIFFVGAAWILAMKTIAEGGTPGQQIAQSGLPGPTNLVMYDRSDAKLEYVIGITGTNIVMQEAIFPNYNARRFWSSTVDKHLRDKISVLIEMGKPLKPPFVPGGPVYGRLIYDKWRLVSDASFSRDDPFSKHLKEFVEVIKTNAEAGTNVPALILQQTELRRQFGM